MAIYYHIHHIIPVHMGGTDDPSNLIKLTVEEHAAAHKKLWEEHGHWQDKVAWQGLSKTIGKDEMIRTTISESNKNRVISSETRKRLSAIHAGRKKSPETREKMRLAHTGKKFSEEHKQNMRKAYHLKKLSSTD